VHIGDVMLTARAEYCEARRRRERSAGSPLNGVSPDTAALDRNGSDARCPLRRIMCIGTPRRAQQRCVRERS
jgi:hypothetical protein